LGFSDPPGIERRGALNGNEVLAAVKFSYAELDRRLTTLDDLALRTLFFFQDSPELELKSIVLTGD